MKSDFFLSLSIEVSSLWKRRVRSLDIYERIKESLSFKRVFSQIQNDNEVIFLSKMASAVQVGGGAVINKHFL